MNEETLFAAYRNSPLFAKVNDAAAIEEIERRSYSLKCVYGSCPTMIATWTGRAMCRFHEGKRKRREL